jgi:hypothetical protein
MNDPKLLLASGINRPIAGSQQHQYRGHRLFFARGIPSLKARILMPKWAV